MVPRPVVIGLTLCEKVIIEERTRNATLVNAFTKMAVPDFPTPPQQFAVHAALTDGRGDAILQLVVTQLRTDREIYKAQLDVHFPDRRAELRVVLRIGSCSFPEPGTYQFTLLIDNEWVAQRDLLLARKDG